MEQIDSKDGDINEECHRVDATLVAKLNLADFQNAVPLLRELSIVNGTKEDAKDLELRIESAPGFLKPKVWRIDAVAAGSTYRITDLDVQLDGPLLTRLTESEKATVTLSLRYRDDAVAASSDLARPRDGRTSGSGARQRCAFGGTAFRRMARVQTRRDRCRIEQIQLLAL